MATQFWRTFTSCAKLLRRKSLRLGSMADLFLPPVNKSMKELDRSFFQKTITLPAAHIKDPKNIFSVRDKLIRSHEVLSIGRIKTLRNNPDRANVKALILEPQVQLADPDSWSSSLKQLVDENVVELGPFNLHLTYDDWTMSEILEAILPTSVDEEQEHPTGFAQAGHVAHLNLRSQYLPYKHLIGQVLLDKSHHTTTVINKTLDVGTESVFRTFPYEVLAGPDDLEVTVNEAGCEFRFNFAKVYWNTRLGTEHERMVAKFEPGQAVCDVMAGVGPFAVPAGKKGVFVHANDLNPDSFASLERAIKRNKVQDFVTASCTDGRAFIQQSAQRLIQSPRRIKQKSQASARRGQAKDNKVAVVIHDEPSTFDHYVMNLPGSAVEFLDAFRGVYHGYSHLFGSKRALPLIHVYLFQRRCETEADEIQEMCSTISKHLGTSLIINDAQQELDLFYVRLVSPNKKMYCASFRLPADVAFAEPIHQSISNGEELERWPHLSAVPG